MNDNKIIEQWRDVPGYESLYQVSDHGGVKSLDRVDCAGSRRQEKALRLNYGGGRYASVLLCKNGKSKPFAVHRLVLETFIEPRPGRMQCRHLNGNPHDNRLCNLARGTAKENAADRFAHGTDCSGEKQWACKLTESDVLEILLSLKSHRELGRCYGVTDTTIARIRRHKKWKHLHASEVSGSAITAEAGSYVEYQALL